MGSYRSQKTTDPNERLLSYGLEGVGDILVACTLDVYFNATIKRRALDEVRFVLRTIKTVTYCANTISTYASADEVLLGSICTTLGELAVVVGL